MSVDIRIENLGPITEFQSQLTEPGLWVLRGKQQSGKTTILRTVQLATDGRTDEKPTKRDGTPKGQAEIAGKTLKISRVVREEGELGIEGLGDLDISTLHQPKFKDAVTRDKYRIATLCRLANVSADESLFYDVLGGVEKFSELVDMESIKTDDLVELAGRIKRSVDAVALEKEKRAESLLAKKNAKADLISEVDLTAPCNEQELQSALSEAIKAHERLKSQRDAGVSALTDAEASREALKAMQAISVESATKAREEASTARLKAANKVQELQRQLDAAKEELAECVADERVAHEAVVSAHENEQLRKRLESSIAAAESIEVPDELTIQAAEEAVKAAQNAVTLGAQVRSAIHASAEVSELESDYKAVATEAQSLRKKAKSVMDVLSTCIGSIPNCPLSVENDDDGNARLVMKTDRSEHEHFDELSDGAKWSVIIPLLCAYPGKMVVLSQAAYGEIQPSKLNMMDELFAERGCYLLSAQVDDGELRCERFHHNEH